MDYQDRVVVLTAAASGIGRESALGFGHRKAKVVVSDLDADGATKVAEEIRSAGGTAISIGCNVAHDEEVAALAQLAFDSFGRVDVVMNHAGVSASGPAHAIPLDNWRFVYEVNILAIARALEVFLPHMAERGDGLIINTSSSLGLFPEVPFALPYITTKAGVIGLSEALALYCKPLGIRVMVLSPDITKTEFHYSGRKTGLDPSKAKGLLPLSQEQMPSDVADALFAAIDNGHFLACNVPDLEQLLQAKAADRNEPRYRVYSQVAAAVDDMVLAVTPTAAANKVA